jgi:hypothetical protein
MRTTVYRTLVMGLNIRLIGLITNNREGRIDLIQPKSKRENTLLNLTMAWGDVAPAYSKMMYTGNGD